MELSAASTFFDRTLAVDAYAPRYKFKCQIEPLDMYRTEGTRIKVRNMSTAPGVTMPSRGVIRIDSQPYLVSDSSSDHWEGRAIRKRYVIQGADYVVEIRTIAQALAGETGTSAYASVDFNKYGTDERDSSDYHPQYHIFFSGTEAVPENAILTSGDRAYLVRNSYRTPAGLTDALSNELDDPFVSVTFKTRTYNPLTDTHSESSSSVNGILIRWQDHFVYLSQGSGDYERGDGQLLVASSVVAKPEDTVELRGVAWRVLSTVEHADFTSLHVRRA
jgi:hypothetical protein